MKISSGSDLLRTQEVKDAVASNSRVESLAIKFDAAHLAAEQDPSQQNKTNKAQAKKALLNALTELKVPA